MHAGIVSDRAKRTRPVHRAGSASGSLNLIFFAIILHRNFKREVCLRPAKFLFQR